MDWRDNYRAQFAALRPEQLLSIEKFIQYKLPGVKLSELNGAVDLLSREWPERYPPRASHILSAIIQAREDKLGPRASSNVRTLMARMTNETPVQRWETVCAGKNNDECWALKQYALSLGTEERPGLVEPDGRDLYKAIAGVNLEDNEEK